MLVKNSAGYLFAFILWLHPHDHTILLKLDKQTVMDGSRALQGHLSLQCGLTVTTFVYHHQPSPNISAGILDQETIAHRLIEYSYSQRTVHNSHNYGMNHAVSYVLNTLFTQHNNIIGVFGDEQYFTIDISLTTRIVQPTCLLNT